MPLSISSSKLTRSTWILLACAVALGVSTEAAARFGLSHISRIQRRIDAEGASSLRIRTAANENAKDILFVGNSLLLEGVDFETLKASLEGRYRAHRYIVESTNFYDWQYGLRRLFREGMRPSAVILCLNAPQLTTPAIRGDFSARMLFGVQDIWPAARATGADLTTTSGYYIAHYSAFYATRSELRAVVMGKLTPAVVVMWQESVTKPAVIPADDQLIPVMEPRLRMMRELCASYGVDFQFLIPPTIQPGDTAIVRAGGLAGVAVLRPIPNGSLSSDFYRDGFHLNEKGAAIFTKAIAAEMLK
jgi:hypothetical protein